MVTVEKGSTASDAIVHGKLGYVVCNEGENVTHKVTKDTERPRIPCPLNALFSSGKAKTSAITANVGM